MRKMAFVAFDIDNSIYDRYDLDVVTDLSGVGYKLKLSTVDGDIESIVTKVVQDKQDIKFKIHFINRAYEKSAVLEQWIEKYSTADKRLALEYNDGMIRRYTEGKLINLSKGEKDEYNQLVREATFKPLTPFFSSIENVIKIKVAAVGKLYPYKYPYCYGQNIVENNEIDNPYILDIPVTVKITGSIYEPTVLLLDEDGEEYSRVQFTGLTLADGEYIIINSADRKIWHFNGSTHNDFSAMTDPSYDTFLRAKSGRSTISINFAPTDTGELTGSWRQYGL
jgi:hypothetical protein